MSDRRKRLPAVNTLLDEAAESGLLDSVPRGLVVEAIRAVLDQARAQGGDAPTSGWLDAVTNRVASWNRSTLREVVNATGVVLHTNLGRAPLSRAAYDAAERALGYSSLEFDLSNGERGSRQERVRALLKEVTGAEDGFAVNNAAVGVFLLLNALGGDGETIVSRGELVEIGGSFRIPDILAQSGSTLVEVGTTNRTRLKDYTLALSPRTRVLLKVHRSNFDIVGFKEETPLEDLVNLGAPRGIPIVHDIGSGLLIDLSSFGLTGEPLVRDSVKSGAVAVFSGDKLVGGPQAGIIVGPAELVARAKSNPLARAFRPDKFTIAALEATLALYRDPDFALREVPVLSMLVADSETLKERATRLVEMLPGSSTQPGESAVGGGSFPGADLPTTLVSLVVESPNSMLAALRNNDPPVIARAADGKVLFDVRTLKDDEFATVRDAVHLARPG